MHAFTEKGYDVNYTWSMGVHGLKQGGLLLPDMLRWLWRDQPVSTDPRNMEERSFAEPTDHLGVSRKSPALDNR